MPGHRQSANFGAGRLIGAGMLGLLCLAGPAAQAASPASIKTPRGDLVIRGNTLMLGTAPLRSLPETAARVSVARSYVYAGQTDVLLKFASGADCPARYRWMAVRAEAVTLSPQFGTCSELTKLQKTKTHIGVYTPAFRSGRATRYDYDGATLVTIEYDQAGKPWRRFETHVAFPEGGGGPEQIAIPVATAGTPPATPLREIPLITEAEFTLRAPTAADRSILKGDIVYEARARGCRAESKEPYILDTRQAGNVKVRETVFPDGCFAERATGPLYGVGVITAYNYEYGVDKVFEYTAYGRRKLFGYIKRQ